MPRLMSILELFLSSRAITLWSSENAYNRYAWYELEIPFSFHSPNFVRLQDNLGIRLGRPEALLKNPHELQDRLSECPGLASRAPVSLMRERRQKRLA